MRARHRFVTGVLLLSLSACDRPPPPATTAATDAAAPASDDSPTPPDTFDTKAIDDYVAAKVKKDGYAALSLAIMQDGKVSFAKGYGVTARSAGAPLVTTDTSFGVGSVTKQFVSACILLLADDGKLSPQDKIAKYLPELTRANEITLYDLMTHESGYPDFYPLDFMDRRMKAPTTPDAILKTYATTKLDFDPGTRWSYSNTGYVALGRVVEKVSGEPFGAFLSRRILVPLGMVHTYFEPDPAKLPKGALAQGYTAFALGEEEPAQREVDQWLYTAGGLYSTPSDLAAWDLALVEGKVLKPASYALMTTARMLPDGRTTSYGCGWGVGPRRGDTVIEHSGAVNGFLSYNAVVPRTRTAVILLSSSDDVDPEGPFEEILGLVMKAERATRVPKVAGEPAKDVAVTLFHALQAGTIDRVNLGDELSAYLTEARLKGAAARLKPLGEPKSVRLLSLSERGGMEHARVELAFADKDRKVVASLYRTPDGKVQQILVGKD